MKIQLSVTPEQGRMLVQILGENRDNFCDDRAEYFTDGEFDDSVRDKTYDDYEALERSISEQVAVESNP